MKTKKSLFERFYDYISNVLFGGKKTIFILFASLSIANSYAQDRKVSVMAGYKAFELSATYTDEETELIFGGSASIVDSGISEKRANTNDKGKIHRFKGDVVPAAFALIGAKFDELNIIGKFGGAYVNQTINGKHESQNIYIAFGVAIDYEVSDQIGIRASYDSVNAVMAGLTFKF